MAEIWLVPPSLLRLPVMARKAGIARANISTMMLMAIRISTRVNPPAVDGDRTPGVAASAATGGR